MMNKYIRGLTKLVDYLILRKTAKKNTNTTLRDLILINKKKKKKQVYLLFSS